MPGFDERLTRELERAARPAAPDHVRLFDDVTRRRAHRSAVRKAQVVTSVVVVLALVAGAVLWLAPRFDGSQPAIRPPTPTPVADAAMLQLRPVLDVTMRVGTPAPTPAALTCQPHDCSSEDLRGGRVVLRGATGAFYTLGPTIVDGTSVVAARNDGVLVPGFIDIAVTLDETGAAALAQATREAVTAPPPQNQIAVVWDGQVVSAPTVQAALTSGQLQLRFPSGAEADAVLAALPAASPSP